MSDVSISFSGQQVLVTGATGFLGGVLAQRLTSDGAKVRALVRSPSKVSQLRRQQAEIKLGDLSDPEILRSACAGCSVIFHVAAALSGSNAEQHKTNVEGTRGLLQAASEAGVQRFVYVSSIAVYGYQCCGQIREEMPLAPEANPYNVTKAEAEGVVRAGTVPYTIIRPGMIYGAGAVNWTGKLFRLAKLNPTPFVGSGEGSVFPIHVDDVVDLMVTAARQPAAAHQIFNCAPDPAPTWREFLGHYARLAGHNHWLPLPTMPFSAVARAVRLFSSSHSALHDLPDQVSFIQRQTTYSMKKARTLLGWSPHVDLATGVAACAPWLREQGWLK